MTNHGFVVSCMGTRFQIAIFSSRSLGVVATYPPPPLSPLESISRPSHGICQTSAPRVLLLLSTRPGQTLLGQEELTH